MGPLLIWVWLYLRSRFEQNKEERELEKLQILLQAIVVVLRSPINFNEEELTLDQANAIGRQLELQISKMEKLNAEYRKENPKTEEEAKRLPLPW